ncbi:MAG: hypothetical protein ACM3SP_09335 [Chloroflexota bacterium]
MKLRKVKNSAAMLGLLLIFFILGGFAVSLAQDSLALGPVHSADWRHGVPAAPAPLDGYTLRVGCSVETVDVPAFSGRVAQGIAVAEKSYAVPACWSVPNAMGARKVALHLLDSVLLI